MRKIFLIFIFILITLITSFIHIKFDFINIKQNYANKEVSYEENKIEEKKQQALWVIDLKTKKTKRINVLDNYNFKFGNISPNKEWLLLLGITISEGDIERGVPILYSFKADEYIKVMGNEFSGFSWESQWYNNSLKLLFNIRNILDLKSFEVKELDLPKDTLALNSKLSPDNSKIVLFTTKPESTNNLASPLEVLIFNDNNEREKRIKTKLLPIFNLNSFQPMPVNFTWLTDDTILIESWDSKNQMINIYKMNLITEKIQLFRKNSHTPMVSPDGKYVTVFTMQQSNKIYNNSELLILDYDGNKIKSLLKDDYEINAFHFNDLRWNDDSSQLFIPGHLINNNLCFLKWDLKKENGILIDLDMPFTEMQVIDILDEEEKIIYMDNL